MRPLRGTHGRLVVVFILFGVLLAGLANPGSANDKKELEKRKRDVSGQIDGARQDLNHSSKALQQAVARLDKARRELSTAENHLATTRGQLSVARAHDREMQRQLTAAQAELRTARADLADGERRVADSEDEVKALTLEALQNPDRGMQAFAKLLQGESPRQFTERLALSRTLSDAQIAKLDQLDAARVMLELQRQAVQKLRDEVASKRQEAAENLQRMEELEAQAVAQQAEISDLVERRNSARRSAQRAKDADERTLAELESQRRSLEAQIRRLAQSEAGRRPNPDSGSGGGGGKLSKPVDGYITSHFGYRIHPISGVRRLHAGTDFGAPCGRPIRAAASGTIVSAGWAGGYGNRTVINHGRMRGVNIVTTYSHMSRYAKRSGSVSRGQVIGYVGTTGASTGCHLHFEVLRNGSFVNPLGWL